MASHILRYVRITNSEKLSDRYVTAQVKEASDLDKRVFGRLFVIVEIANPWFPSSQVGQTIINTASREYFKSDETDLEARFEATLKKINETLDHVAKTSDAEWLEELHAVIVLQVENQLHIANTGLARGWIVRDGKGSAVFEPVTPTGQASKTFTSVLSGVLEPGDRLILASSGLTTVLDESELAGNIFAAPDMSTSALRLATLLKAKRGQWVNAVIVEYQDEATAANQSVQSLPDTLYLDTGNVGDWRVTSAQLLGKTREGIVVLSGHLKRAGSALNQWIRHTVAPASQKAWESSQTWSRQRYEDFQTKAAPALKSGAAQLGSQLKSGAAAVQTLANRDKASTPTPSPIAQVSQSASARQPSRDGSDASLIGQSVFAINDYQHEGAVDDMAPELEVPEPEPEGVRHYRAPVASTKPTFKLPSITLPNLDTQNWKISRQSLIFGGIVVLLLILIGSNLWAMSSRRSESVTRTEAAGRLTELQDQLEEAKLAKIFNQPDKAITAAESVLVGSTELASTSLADDAKEVGAEAQGIIDSLTSTKRLSTIEELAAVKGSTLAIWEDHLTVAAEDGTLSTVGTSGGESQSLKLPDGEVSSALTAFDEKSGLAVLSDAPNVYQTNNASGPLEAIAPASGGWKTGQAMASFFNSLYILSPSENQIWRYVSTEGNYSTAESYRQDDTSVADGVDLAIDGSVYVLTNKGEVIKFNRGKRVEFLVRDIPKPNDAIKNPTQIEIAGEAIYVLDGTRILKLAGDGRFDSQYALDGNQPIRAFTIKDTTLYLLTDSHLVKTAL